MKFFNTTVLTCLIPLALGLDTTSAQEKYGELIFHDEFERSESQEEKDEPGNEWTTSSDKTAKGNKEVDLRDGYLYIYTHAEANHATSVRHAFAFVDGTIGMKLRFDDAADSIMLNFTDLGEKSVHAGHLFNVDISPTEVRLEDLKTGKMNLEIRKDRKTNSLTTEQSDELKSKETRFAHQLELGKWHQIYATVKSDEVTCEINGKTIGSLKSPGIAHEKKTLIRLLAPKNVSVDDVKIWRAR